MTEQEKAEKSVVAQRIYQLAQSVPAGKVTTYGAIAKVLNINPRQVGYWLHRNPNQHSIPCHRIVNSQGKLAEHFAFGGHKGQEERLTNEHVAVRHGKVDLTHYFIAPSVA